MEIIQKPDGYHYITFSKVGGRIMNEILTVAGVPGTGKSVLVNEMCHVLWRKEKRTIIYLTEKVGNPYANAFCAFLPDQKWQINLMKQWNMPKGISIPIKLYHPFTFGGNKKHPFPFQKHLPPIQLYTHNIHNFTEEDISILCATKEDLPTVHVFKEAVEQLKEEDNFSDLLWNLAESGEEDFEIVDKDFFIPMKSQPKGKYLGTIKRMLLIFKKHYYIASNDKKGIDWIKLLNDNEHWHFFSQNWLHPSKRCVYLDIYRNLVEIDEALNTNKVKNSVVIVIEEIKALLPSTKQTIYEEMLSSKIRELLTRIRTKAFVITTTQSLAYTDQEIINSSSGMVFLFRQAPIDIKRLSKDYQFNVNEQEMVNDLANHEGTFAAWNVKEKDSIGSKLSETNFKAYVTQSKVAEQGDDFFREFAKEYPEQLTNHFEDFKYFSAQLEEEVSGNKERYKNLKALRKKKEEEKAEEDQKQKEIETLKKKITENTTASKDDKIKLILELKAQGLSNRKIAERLGMSHSHINQIVKKGDTTFSEKSSNLLAEA